MIAGKIAWQEFLLVKVLYFLITYGRFHGKGLSAYKARSFKSLQISCASNRNFWQ